jgi:hypothetical protein
MEDRIQPDQVTKPIQLLAAWLVGLIAVDGSFLTAAGLLTRPVWAPSALVIAAVCNVPLFLISLFMLQTRFRPEMQEDSYYAKYLEVQQTTRKPENTVADVQLLRTTIAESGTRAIEVVENLQGQVIKLTEQVSAIAARAVADSSGQSAVASIARALEVSRDDLTEAKKEIQWQAYSIKVNDLLARYEDISALLVAARIPITGTFGSTSRRAERPEHYVIAFGRRVPLEAVQEILRILADTAPEYIEYAEDELNVGNLYVGSYGYGGRPVLKLTSEMLAQVLQFQSIGQLRDAVIKSPITLRTTIRQRSWLFQRLGA